MRKRTVTPGFVSVVCTNVLSYAGMKSLSASHRVNAGLALLLAAIAFFAFQLIGTLRVQQQLSVDLAEVNSIKYGMLNADEWVQQVAAIVEKRIRTFKLTPNNRKAAKRILEQVLETFITEADRHLREQSKKGNWWKRKKGAIKQSVQNRLVDMDTIKAGIPGYADKILDTLNTPKTRVEINDLLKDLLNDASDTTFAVMNDSPVVALHARYGCKERESCQQQINQQLVSQRGLAVRQALTVLALTLVLFACVCAAAGPAGNTQLALLALCCGVLMLSGVLTPMIEVEARIVELRFALLGEPVVFTDQILYFQSKSVVDIVQVLVKTGKPEMILVGVLVIAFSVIFPLAKLAASFVYLYDLKGWRRSAITHFFALKSGKWSMADVFVVAMFMAYVGFDAMMSSQLTTFAEAGGENVDVLTTNGTSLQIGFFMFLAFCIASLVTSTLIDARSEMKPVQERRALTAE